MEWTTCLAGENLPKGYQGHDGDQPRSWERQDQE